MSKPSIDEVQDEIIEEFAILGNDREITIFYIMELGNKLPPLDEQFKTPENIIKGCQSKVWLTSELDGDRLNFLADSNTEITKGLISLLIRVLSGQKLDDIIKANLYFIDKIGMSQLIGSQRSNGFTSMIKQMKLYAYAYKSKIESEA
ncbi:MAG: SufE family protein [Bacteroidota bacterium]|nr:SufE family protein [Bacteroidota bacterium]